MQQKSTLHSHCYFQEDNQDRNVFSFFGYGAMHINIAVNVPELAKILFLL